MPTVLKTASRCALAGAAAALLVALGDFGASWLWLSNPSDRIELGLRLLGTQVPVGALAGALLGAFAHLSVGPMRRVAARLGRGERDALFERRLWPVPFVLLASPALVTIAWLLFTGGSASKLPMRPLLVGVAALVLASGSYLALRVGRALLLGAPSLSRGRAWLLAAALFGVHFGLAKINQIILPGLYGYLHGLLMVASWLVAALGIAVVALRSTRLAALDRKPAIGLTAVAILVGVLFVNVGTLASNQTVRVALLSPRAAASRSLMLGIGPVLASLESRAAADAAERARRAREGRRRSASAGGPTLEGAHVMLVTIDALRADHLGLYGYETRPVSPSLDRFAEEEAIIFEAAYAVAPHSSYSICSLMTSDYLYQRIHLGLPVPSETLASVLRTVGYHTTASYIEGIFHTDGESMEQYRASKFGFAETSHSNLDAERRTDEAIDRIQRIVEAGEPPTFFWTHYFDVHEPYRDTTFGTTDIERYDGEIRKVDRAFERLIREVRARVTRPLIIVVTADHGEEFRDHGGVYHGSTVYQEQIRVPLLIHVPGVAPRRVQTPVELVDVAPTLLNLLEVPVAPSMQGDDLRSFFTSDEADFGPVFASAGTKHMAVDWPYKLIADLRFGTRELYDLVADPRERENLANRESERVSALEGELQAWLDSLSDSALDPNAAALYRGRLADQTAAPALGALMLDEAAEPAMRAEAARLLANIQHPEVVPSLRRAARVQNADVAAEALIALAWLREDPARERLRALLEDDDLQRRVRAAVGLGRLRDREATPVLIEALDETDAVEERIRFEALRLLGYLGDARAVDPLLDLLDDVRMRRRAVLALGRIGDLRALEPLIDQLTNAQHTTVRDSAARALAHLGDARAVPALVHAAIQDRLPGVSEALVRLRAVGSAVGGLDVRPGTRGEGLGECKSIPDDREEWSFLERTTCETRGARASLPLALPSAVRDARSSVMLVRMRRIDAGAAVPVRVSVGERAFDAVRVDGEWSEQRFPLTPGELAPRVVIEAEGEARLELDHVLVVPEP